MEMHKYKAFLSYSHRDKAWADWLHRSLETYKFPKNISEAKSDTLKPIFRDREELSVSSDLSSRVKEALLHSESLIVICSENAVQSNWVNREIKLFQSLKPVAEIFPVIVSGEPYAERQGVEAAKECFPPALHFKPAKSEDTAPILREPLAADLRKNKDGKQLGLVKLIAGIANIRLDDLIQRDLRRARKRMIAITSGASIIVLALSLMTISTIFSRQAAERNEIIAQEQRALAELRRDKAEELIEFMLGDLRQELEPVGRLALLTNVADRALDYYSQVDEDLSNCKSASGAARAKYLHTRIAVSQDKFKLARKYSDEALNLLSDASSQCNTVKQFVTNHAHAIQWSADLDIIDHQFAQPNTINFNQKILAKYQLAKTNLNNFKGDGEYSSDMATEKADADLLIGKYYMDSRQHNIALKHFEKARKTLDPHYTLRSSPPTSPTSDLFAIHEKYADSLTWISGAYENLSQLNQAFETLQRAREIYVSLNMVQHAEDENWKARFDIIGTDYALSRLLYKQGKHEAALEILTLQKKDIDKLVSQDPSNQSWRKLQTKITSSISALATTTATQP